MASPTLKALRECSARLVAAAVCRAFPNTQILRGGASESGFYYEFHFEIPPDEQIFPLIEEQLRVLATEDLKVRSHTMERENAREFFKHKNQYAKAEELKRCPQIIEVLQIGDFYDECPLPHLSSIKDFKNLKLLEIEKRGGVCRIIGTAFPDQKQLKNYLKKIKSRLDHREYGEKERLFCLIEKISKSEWFLGPFFSGVVDVIKEVWKNLCFEAGFTVVESPKIDSKTLLASHGAFAEFLGNDVPVRIAEFTRISHEASEPHVTGLLRPPKSWGDQWHIFCLESQVDQELISSLHFIEKWNKMLSIKGEWVLSTNGRKEKNVLPCRERAETFLREALAKSGISTTLREESEEESFEKKSFIGPALKFQLIDDLDRRFLGSYVGLWQAFPKISLKIQEPLWVIGGSFISSVERDLALLLEKGEGKLPLQFLPEQVRIFPLETKHERYAEEIERRCRLQGLKVRIDKRDLSLPEKLKQMELDGVGYGLFVGDREQQKEKVSVRSGYDQREHKDIDLNEFFLYISTL